MRRRRVPDWLAAYVQYASFTEAPPYMHFWSGVSAIAGALRRKVWIDQIAFKWLTNMYIVLVAPPGVVSKTTTAALAIDLLQQIEGVHFGPQIVTWEALVQSFQKAAESVDVGGREEAHAAITIESGELGNLLDPTNKQMVDLLVSLWDGKALKKETKTNGMEHIENPWINLIACTTPSWITVSFPEYMIGGGFMSRCLFVHADRKAKLVPYPALVIPPDHKAKRAALIEDLQHIATLRGGYELTADAIRWGSEWYAHHWSRRPAGLDDDRYQGYLARKQTHIHKLAIVVAAAQRDEPLITGTDLAFSTEMVTQVEQKMPQVFKAIGRTTESAHVDRLLEFIRRQGPQGCTYREAFKAFHAWFPHARDFSDVVVGARDSGQIRVERIAGTEDARLIFAEGH